MADLDLAAPAVRPPDTALSLGRAVVEMDDRAAVAVETLVREVMPADADIAAEADLRLCGGDARRNRQRDRRQRQQEGVRRAWSARAMRQRPCGDATASAWPHAPRGRISPSLGTSIGLSRSSRGEGPREGRLLSKV